MSGVQSHPNCLGGGAVPGSRGRGAGRCAAALPWAGDLLLSSAFKPHWLQVQSGVPGPMESLTMQLGRQACLSATLDWEQGPKAVAPPSCPRETGNFPLGDPPCPGKVPSAWLGSLSEMFTCSQEGTHKKSPRACQQTVPPPPSPGGPSHLQAKGLAGSGGPGQHRGGRWHTWAPRAWEVNCGRNQVSSDQMCVGLLFWEVGHLAGRPHVWGTWTAPQVSDGAQRATKAQHGWCPELR